MPRRDRPIVVAEDDLDDRELTRDAFAALNISNPIEFFDDGADLLEYLRSRTNGNAQHDDLPAMVLLDLNMPRIDGRQALRLIRSDVRFQHLPVVILSTSRSEADISASYKDGANTYITKPERFQGMVEALRNLNGLWSDAVASIE
jgi:two-component system, response regulator